MDAHDIKRNVCAPSIHTQVNVRAGFCCIRMCVCVRVCLYTLTGVAPATIETTIIPNRLIFRLSLTVVVVVVVVADTTCSTIVSAVDVLAVLVLFTACAAAFGSSSSSSSSTCRSEGFISQK